MKSIILIAAPSAGKGTEAALLQKDYKIPHISSGDLLRDKAKEQSELGKEINNRISKGLFVEDELIISMLEERISMEDCNNGYVLDGFPRNVKQAIAYESMLKELNKDNGIVIVLDIDKDIAASRIMGRIVCSKCKRVYNTQNESLKPKIKGICDDCGIELIHREDDNEQVYMGRYNTYIEQTSPLIDYYKEKNILYHVDANSSIENTHKQVCSILESLK